MNKFASLILAASATCYIAYAEKFADITPQELQAALAQKKVAVIDCNGSGSYKTGHIPGAIDFDANEAKLGSLLPKDKKTLVVAYCGGPKCNAYESGAEAARKLGYTNVKHLKAGLSGWQAAKLPLEK